MAVVTSKVVPTEYDVEEAPFGRVVLIDDRGRRFVSFTLQHALRKAEKAQDPRDPIHFPPYPGPKGVPLP